MSFSISDRMEKKEGGEDAPGPAVCLQVGAGRRPGHRSLEAGLTPTAPLGVLSSWPTITHSQSRVFWDHAQVRSGSMEVCHGFLGESEHPDSYKNRITETCV